MAGAAPSCAASPTGSLVFIRFRMGAEAPLAVNVAINGRIKRPNEPPA